MSGTIAVPIRGGQHVGISFHHIVAHQREAPALHLVVRVVAAPVAYRAEIATGRIVRRQVELHVEVVLVVNLWMVRKREYGHLVEVLEPAELRAEIKEAVDEMAKRYSK